jgi:type IV pilus assembly protein PilQ
MIWLVVGMPHALAGHPAAMAAHATLKSITRTDPSLGNEVLLQIEGEYSFKTIHTPEGALYVDLLGVEQGAVSPSTHWANGLVAGYQLLGFTDARGEPVLRVEVQTRGAEPLIAERGSSGLRLLLGQSPPASSTPTPPAKGAGPSPGKTAEGRALVSDILISPGSGGEATIDVATTKAATFHVYRFDHPDRLVMDLEGVRNAVRWKSLPVSCPVVKDVRVGQFREKDPEVVRVVADLSGNPVFDAHAYEGGVRVEVKPHPTAFSRAVAPEPAPTPETAAKSEERKPIQQAVVVPARQVAAPPAHPAASAAPAPAARVETAAKREERKPIQQAVVVPARQVAAPPAHPVASAASVPAARVETLAKREERKPIQQAVVVPARQVAAPPAHPVASAARVPAARVETVAEREERKAIQQAVVVPPRQVLAPPARPVASAATEPQTGVIPKQPSAVASIPERMEEALKPENNRAVPASEGTRDAAAAPPQTPQPAALPQTPQAASPEPLRTEGATQVPSVETASNLALAQGTIAAGPPPGEQKPAYTGELISLNLKDVDLKDFFRLIHELSGLNILVDPNVTGSVTTALDNVPWDQALDIVLKNNGLGKVLEGNVLRVAKLETLAAEQEAASKMAAARLETAPLVTVFRPVNYAKATAIAALLTKWAAGKEGGGALSKRGTVLVDERTNTLIISDIASQIPIIQGVVARLDTKTKQVAIEARIVLANSSFQRTLGAALVGAVSNRSGSTIGAGQMGTGASVTPSTTTTPPSFTIPQNPTTGFGVVAITNWSQRYMIDAAISAAEIRSQAKTISRPSIITQTNTEGMVQQGTQIPVQTSINNTISVQYMNATLQLTVTPQVTDDGHIFLNIKIQNASPGTIETNAAVSINIQQATTEVLVPDGGTVVFGGVAVTQRQNSSTGIPVLGNIPLLGHLFKTTTVQDTDQELLFFVSPRVLTS